MHKDIIYCNEEIKQNLLKLKENIENSYEFSVKNEKLFFSYLFEYKTKDKYSDMIEKCKNNKSWRRWFYSKYKRGKFRLGYRFRKTKRPKLLESKTRISR